jgi:photosystem II stability/assembly factor-like uncharacterized protein
LEKAPQGKRAEPLLAAGPNLGAGRGGEQGREADMKSGIKVWKLNLLLLLVLGGVLVLVGCKASKGPEAAGKLTVADVTQPAELVLQDGTCVTVPPGALPARAMITIRKVDPSQAPALPEGFDGAETLYEISADRPLQKPVTLRFPMPKVVDEEVFQLSRYRNGQWELVPFAAQNGFAVVQTDALSIWGWLKTTTDWIDEQIMKYANPDTYIKWFRDVTGLDRYMEIPLEGFSDLLDYDDSEAKGLISASARIVEGDKIRLRVRNETKFYLQLSFDGPTPVVPRRGAYVDADTVLRFMRMVTPGAALASDMLKEFLPNDVLLLPEGTAEFITEYVPGKALVITARWTDIAAVFSTLDPALGLVPIVDLEIVTAARDVLGEGSLFVRALPDLEKGWREHAMNLLDVMEAAGRVGVLAAEKALKSLADKLVVPFAVNFRKEYLEGRAIDILEKGEAARLGGVITITYLAGTLDRTPPTMPTNLKATAVSPTQIDLSWDASTDNVGVAGYRIYQNGSFLTSVTTTSYSDTSLSPSTRYCYQVSAYDAAGNESARSNEACATTPGEQQTKPGSAPKSGLAKEGIRTLVIDPKTPTTIYVGATRYGTTAFQEFTGQVGGVFKSIDGGGNWNPVNKGLTNNDVQALAIDPVTPSTIYAGTRGGGVYKSTDGGMTWNPTGLTEGDVIALAIDPKTPTTIYAGRLMGGLFKSTDGGRNWVFVGFEGESVDALVIDPRVPTTIYADTSKGLFKSSDGGEHWIALGLNLPVFDLALDPTRPTTIYAIAGYLADTRVFKSTDGGRSWEEIGLHGESPAVLAVDPVTPTTIYVGTDWGGLFKSRDGGETWEATGLTCLWGPCRLDSDVSEVVVDPITPTTLYVVRPRHGVFKSIDGGKTWSAVNATLSGTSTQTLVIDPKMPTTVYAGTRDFGVFKSKDGGALWSAASTGLGNTDVQALAIDPVMPTTLYAGTKGGVYKSADSGMTWNATGLTNSNVASLAIDPGTPIIIYAGTYGRGVFKSTDGSETWSTTGLTNADVHALIIDPKRPTTIYAGTSDGVYITTDGGNHWSATTLNNIAVWSLAIDPKTSTIIYAGTQGGVYKTTDGGNHWSPAGLSHYDVWAVLIDPNIPTTIYAGTLGGVYKSTDGGQTWSITGLNYITIQALAISPEINTIFAGTPGGVYKSTDGGVSWTQ